MTECLTIKSFKLPAKPFWINSTSRRSSGIILSKVEKRIPAKLEIKVFPPKNDDNTEDGEIVETPKASKNVFKPADSDTDSDKDVQTPKANSFRSIRRVPVTPYSNTAIRRHDTPRTEYSPYASSRRSSVFRSSALSIKSWQSNADSWRSVSKSTASSRLSCYSTSSRLTNCNFYRPGEGPENLAPGKIIRIPVEEDWDPSKTKTRYAIVVWLDVEKRTFTFAPGYTNCMTGIPIDHATEFMPLSHPESKDKIVNTTAWAPLFIERLYEGTLKPDAAYTWPRHSNVRVTDPVEAIMDKRVYHVVGELREEDTKRLVSRVKYMAELPGEDTLSQMLRRRSSRKPDDSRVARMDHWTWN